MKLHEPVTREHLRALLQASEACDRQVAEIDGAIHRVRTRSHELLEQRQAAEARRVPVYDPAPEDRLDALLSRTAEALTKPTDVRAREEANRLIAFELKQIDGDRDLLEQEEARLTAARAAAIARKDALEVAFLQGLAWVLFHGYVEHQVEALGRYLYPSLAVTKALKSMGVRHTDAPFYLLRDHVKVALPKWHERHQRANFPVIWPRDDCYSSGDPIDHAADLAWWRTWAASQDDTALPPVDRDLILQNAAMYGIVPDDTGAEDPGDDDGDPERGDG